MTNVYYRAQALEAIARKTVLRLGENYLNLPPQAVPIETLIESIFGLTIEYKYLTRFGDELGKMVYDDGYVIFYDREKDDYAFLEVRKGTMLIDASLTEAGANYGRLRFTYAHELSHWILHYQLFSGTGTAAALYGSEKTEDSTEWQANYLAQAILMPVGQVKRCFYSLRRFGGTDAITEQMMEVFEVSKQAMGYRLNGLGLLR